MWAEPPVEIQAVPTTVQEVFRHAERLHANGHYAEAEPLCREALAEMESVHGPDGAEVIPVLNALANLYHAQGRERDAEPVCRRALELGESRLQPQDPEIAVSLNTLADIYRMTYRHVAAEPLYRRSLAILNAAPVSPNPKTVPILSYLA